MATDFMDQLPPEITFKLSIEKDDKEIYSVGLLADRAVMNIAREDALVALFRILERRVLGDWKDKEF